MLNIIVSLVMMIVSYLLQMSMQKQMSQNAIAGQLDVPTATEGEPIPVVFGSILIKSSNIVDYFSPATTEVMSKKTGKGK